MIKALLFLTLTASAFSVSAETTKDSGKVINIYSTPQGEFAFKLEGGRAGIQNAASEHGCATSEGWIGATTTDKSFIFNILAAKVSGIEVDVFIDGCTKDWFKPQSIYLNQ